MIRRNRVLPGDNGHGGKPFKKSTPAERLDTPALKALLDEYLDFPEYKEISTSQMSIWRLVPCLMPPFLYRRRWIEFFLFCGPTLKNSLLEEFSTHIVIEALLLTIIVQPLLDMNLELDLWRHAVLYVMLYCSSVLSIICISVHILAVVAIVAVDERLLLEYVASQLDAFIIMGSIHTKSYFTFLACIAAWPALSIKGSDPYYVKWLCAALFVGFVLISTLPWGSVGRVSYILQPQLQILHKPNDEELRKQVEKNVLLLSEGLEIHLLPEAKPPLNGRPSSNRLSFYRGDRVGGDAGMANKNNNAGVRCTGEGKVVGDININTVGKLLDAIGMAEYADRLTQQSIADIETMQALENEDYTALGITIGDRIKIKKHLAGLASGLPRSLGGN